MTKIKIEELTELDPSKIYFLKTDCTTDVYDTDSIRRQLENMFKQYGIRIMLLNSNLEFVDPPKKEITNIILKDLDSFGLIHSAIKGMFR